MHKENVFARFSPWSWYGIALVVLLLDQWSKTSAANAIVYGHTDVVTSFFNLTMRYNHGVAFSILDDAEGSQRWYLAALAFVISVVIAVWIVRTGKKNVLEAAGLALILGGALGNLYDRVVLGYVIDFIEVHYQGYYWPAFNIADAGVCVGAGLLLFDGFFSSRTKEKKAD